MSEASMMFEMSVSELFTVLGALEVAKGHADDISAVDCAELKLELMEQFAEKNQFKDHANDIN